MTTASDSEKLQAEETFRRSVLAASMLLVEMERVHGEGNWLEIAQALALRVRMMERERDKR